MILDPFVVGLGDLPQPGEKQPCALNKGNWLKTQNCYSMITRVNWYCNVIFGLVNRFARSLIPIEGPEQFPFLGNFRQGVSAAGLIP